jgi:hypothetical protein
LIIILDWLYFLLYCFFDVFCNLFCEMFSFILFHSFFFHFFNLLEHWLCGLLTLLLNNGCILNVSRHFSLKLGVMLCAMRFERPTLPGGTGCGLCLFADLDAVLLSQSGTDGLADLFLAHEEFLLLLDGFQLFINEVDYGLEFSSVESLLVTDCKRNERL